MILPQQSVSLPHQFFIHTDCGGKLWRPIEFIINTPLGHRVHHGSDQQYLDKNCGGIRIVRDGRFGTFEAGELRVVYGLTRSIKTLISVRLATCEFAAIWRDTRASRTWRRRWGHALRRPGRSPEAG